MHTAEANTPAAHVGHAEAFEQPLHRAVFAERPVQGRKHHVDAGNAAPGLERQHRAIPAPHPVTVHLDRHRQVSGRLNALTHRRGGGQRHLVLGGAATPQHRDPETAHVVVVVLTFPVVGVVLVDDELDGGVY